MATKIPSHIQLTWAGISDLQFELLPPLLPSAWFCNLVPYKSQASLNGCRNGSPNAFANTFISIST